MEGLGLPVRPPWGRVLMKQVQTWGRGMAQQESWWPWWGQFKHTALCPATLSAQPGWEGRGWFTHTHQTCTHPARSQAAGRPGMEGREAQAAWGLGCGLRAESGRQVSADLSSPTNVVLLGTLLPPGPRRACRGCGSRALPASQAGRHVQGPVVRVTAGRALGLHQPAGPGPSPGPSLPLPWPNACLHPGPEARSSQKHSVLLQVPRPVGSAL